MQTVAMQALGVAQDSVVEGAGSNPVALTDLSGFTVETKEAAILPISPTRMYPDVTGFFNILPI